MNPLSTIGPISSTQEAGVTCGDSRSLCTLHGSLTIPTSCTRLRSWMLTSDSGGGLAFRLPLKNPLPSCKKLEVFKKQDFPFPCPFVFYMFPPKNLKWTSPCGGAGRLPNPKPKSRTQKNVNIK